MKYTKRLLLPLTFTFSLYGCQTTSTDSSSTSPVFPDTVAAEQLLADTGSCCDSLQKLPFEKLPIDSGRTYALGPEQVIYAIEGDEKSFLRAFQFPDTPSTLNMRITSIASEKAILAPTVWLLDAEFKLLKSFTASQFTYKPARLFDKDRLEIEIPATGKGSGISYMIVFSGARDRSGTTTLLHPAKAYAQASGRVVPDIPDPVVKHSVAGLIAIDTSEVELAYSQPELEVHESSPRLPENVQYDNQIREAVAQNDIEKALKLVDEAEAKGFTDSRAVFVEAVKKMKP